MQKGAPHDIFDYATAAGNDKVAFNKFKNTLLFNQTIRKMQDLDEEKVSYLLERWTGKRIKYFKGKVLACVRQVKSDAKGHLKS